MYIPEDGEPFPFLFIPCKKAKVFRRDLGVSLLLFGCSPVITVLGSSPNDLRSEFLGFADLQL